MKAKKSCPSEAVYQAVRDFMREYRLKTFPTQEMLRECGRSGLYYQIRALGGTEECAKQMGIALGKHQATRESRKQSLCWSCKHAVPNPEKGNIDFRPVRGWEATKKEYRVPKCSELMISYRVQACPKFVEG